MQVKKPKYLRLAAALIFLGAASLLFFASAQERSEKQEKREKPENQEEPAQIPTIRVDTDLVSIDVAVTDRQGNLVGTLLKAQDFVVYEDGVRQKISNFSAADAAFNLTLLIDTSGSTRDEIELMRRAARRFLDELRPQDQVAIVQFNKQVELIQDLTTDRGKLEAALDKLKGGGGTAFYDALDLTIGEVFKELAGRKAIIALTDGVDSYGDATLDQLTPALEKGNSTIYFLELDTEAFTEAGYMRDCRESSHFEFSRKQLKKYVKEYLQGGDAADYEDHCSLPSLERRQISTRLYQSARREVREMAKQTGGRVYPVKELSRLDPAYSQIAAELRTQYSLAYYPTNDKRDGKWRTLRIEVKRPGLVVRNRPGYRAPQEDSH
ncbi:MAG TPA: VWA domain-containing protein [Blastocatellia bacterium]|nr:VWA domain-containing protein [Blastocatellia bacterium]